MMMYSFLCACIGYPGQAFSFFVMSCRAISGARSVNSSPSTPTTTAVPTIRVFATTEAAAQIGIPRSTPSSLTIITAFPGISVNVSMYPPTASCSAASVFSISIGSMRNPSHFIAFILSPTFLLVILFTAFKPDDNLVKVDAVPFRQQLLAVGAVRCFAHDVRHVDDLLEPLMRPL